MLNFYIQNCFTIRLKQESLEGQEVTRTLICSNMCSEARMKQTLPERLHKKIDECARK